MIQVSHIPTITFEVRGALCDVAATYCNLRFHVPTFFQNLVNVDVNTKKLTCDERNFDTRIHPEVREFINLISIHACSPVRYDTVEVENGL